MDSGNGKTQQNIILDRFRDSALKVASQAGDIEMAKLLIQNGANVNLQSVMCSVNGNILTIISLY
jgi:hypothetical protein